MTKLFIDINVILDIPFQRTPHQVESQKILSLVESRMVEGCTSAMTCATVYYLVKREAGARAALSFIKNLLQIFTIIEVNRSILDRALEPAGVDFEDNIQMACAEKIAADYIITRNLKDYRHSVVPVLSPAQYLALR